MPRVLLPRVSAPGRVTWLASLALRASLRLLLRFASYCVARRKVAKEKARPTSGTARLAARLPSHWWPGSAPSHDGAPLSLRCSPGVHASRPPRNTSTRPPDGIEIRVACKNQAWLWRCFFCTTSQAAPTAPFRRVSAVVVSGRAVWARREGQACSCTPFPERGWNAGSDGETSVFACFFGAGHPASEENESPGRAKPGVRAAGGAPGNGGTSQQPRSASAKQVREVASAEPAAKSPARRPCRSYRPTATAPTVSCAAR